MWLGMADRLAARACWLRLRASPRGLAHSGREMVLARLASTWDSASLPEDISLSLLHLSENDAKHTLGRATLRAQGATDSSRSHCCTHTLVGERTMLGARNTRR